VIRRQDYIGLDLLVQLDTETQKSVSLHFALEHSDLIVPHIQVQTSIDGYNWLEPRPAPSIECHSTGHLSNLPVLPLPSTFLTSDKAQDVLDDAMDEQRRRGKGWLSRKLVSAAVRSRLDNCAVEIPTNAGVGRRRKGWRFVRLVVVSDDGAIVDEAGLGIGWGVYEMWIA